LISYLKKENRVRFKVNNIIYLSRDVIAMRLLAF
jgi:hypothetical protein